MNEHQAALARLVIAVSGASGAIYAVRLLKACLELGLHIELIVSVYTDIGVFSEGADLTAVRLDLLELLDRYYGVPARNIDMTQAFYEQLGVKSTASQGEIRSAYAGAVAQLRRRRKALVDKGGDTAQIDLHRGEIDEAFSVLSDPVRRRRYDATNCPTVMRATDTCSNG